MIRFQTPTNEIGPKVRPKIAKIRSHGRSGAQAAALTVSPSHEELLLELELLSPSQPELELELELVSPSHPELLELELVSPSQPDVSDEVGVLVSPSQPEVSGLFGSGSPPPQPSSAGAVETGMVGVGLGSGTRCTGPGAGQ